MNNPIPLNSDTLPNLSEHVRIPAYDREKVRAGIVHIGVGGFHRAHQALYVDNYLAKALSEKAEAEWGICGVGLLKYDQKMQSVLQKQDCLYTLVERSPEQDSARVIGSIVEYLYAPDNPQAVIDKLASAECKIVTLTITEGGYYVIEGTGGFDKDHPTIQHDLKNPEQPKGVCGFLAAALRRRQAQGLPPFTLLSCDNIQGNGDTARRMLLSFAELQDPDLAKWLSLEGAFPNSMVDRITPSTTPADIEMVSEQFGIQDEWPVVAEPFLQWVIEDKFCAGRPSFESVGVQMTDDVHPYEMMKLRLLNASHSLLGYAGSLLGYTYSSEAMEDKLVRRAIERMMDEASSTLPPLPGIQLSDYKQTLIERFSNPKVQDQLSRLCLNGSDKMPKFVLGSVRDKLDKGESVTHLSLAIALWFRYLNGQDEQGNPLPLDDSMAEILRERALAGKDDPTPLLGIEAIFGDLAGAPTFVDTLSKHLQQLYALGTKEKLARLLS